MPHRPAVRGKQRGRPAPAQKSARESLEKRCVLRETRAERYGGKTGSDRRSNAAMGRTNRATALTSNGGLIPSNERPAAGRRE
jgi:hypothetical protein